MTCSLDWGTLEKQLFKHFGRFLDIFWNQAHPSKLFFKTNCRRKSCQPSAQMLLRWLKALRIQKVENCKQGGQKSWQLHVNFFGWIDNELTSPLDPSGLHAGVRLLFYYLFWADRLRVSLLKSGHIWLFWGVTQSQK